MSVPESPRGCGSLKSYSWYVNTHDSMKAGDYCVVLGSHQSRHANAGNKMMVLRERVHSSQGMWVSLLLLCEVSRL